MLICNYINTLQTIVNPTQTILIETTKKSANKQLGKTKKKKKEGRKIYNKFFIILKYLQLKWKFKVVCKVFI